MRARETLGRGVDLAGQNTSSHAYMAGCRPFSHPRFGRRRPHHAKSARLRMPETPKSLEKTSMPAPPVNVDRVFDALEAAARAAEGKAPDPGAVAVTLDDFRAAVKLDAKAVRARLDRVVMGDDPELGLDALLDAGALAALFPEVHAMVGFGDGEWRHKDVWKHTKQVVRQSVPRLEVRWAALFHDIGKVKTRLDHPRRQGPLPRSRRGRHAHVRQARPAHAASSRYEPTLKDTVRFLVLHHLRANQYSPDWTDSAVRRFARELGEHLDDLLCLARADITTKRPEKKRKGLQQIEELAAAHRPARGGGRARPAAAERHRRRDHARLRPPAVAPDRRRQARARGRRSRRARSSRSRSPRPTSSSCGEPRALRHLAHPLTADDAPRDRRWPASLPQSSRSRCMHG